MNKAVFLDRDGTIIRDCEYLNTVEGVAFLPGALEALKRLQDAGYLLVLITNQAGIGRGLVDEPMVLAQHEYIRGRLAEIGCRFAAVEYCPHAPDVGCSCRKPAPGMLLRAAGSLGIDLPASFTVGDRETDVLAGKAAGTRAILLAEAAVDSAADAIIPSLAKAVDWILNTPAHEEACR